MVFIYKDRRKKSIFDHVHVIFDKRDQFFWIPRQKLGYVTTWTGFFNCLDWCTNFYNIAEILKKRQYRGKL